MIRTPILPFAVVLSAMSLPALAEDATAGLPGVDGTFSVVSTAAEPTEEITEVSPYGEGFVRVPGTDTYVKISGLIRYDVEFRGQNRK
jgi:hypothetical protein